VTRDETLTKLVARAKRAELLIIVVSCILAVDRSVARCEYGVGVVEMMRLRL